MAWTYSTSLATDKDKVRFEIGDTDTTDQLLSDEEIAALLTSEGTVAAAAAKAAEGLAAKYSRLADRTVGNFSLSASQRAKAYWELAKKLGAKAGIWGIPTAGGWKQSDDDTLNADEDRKRLVIRAGVHDMPKGDSVPT